MHVIHIILVYIFIALAVYCRSPSAYDALKLFGIVQLPSKSLQLFTENFLHDAGANKSCIADQVTKYLLFCTQLQGDETKKESKKGWSSYI